MPNRRSCAPRELESLTAALRRAGRSVDGLPIARRALAIDEKVFGPEHPNTAGDHMNIGAVLEDMQKDDEARVEIERSLAIWDKTLPPNHTNLGLAHNALGAVLLQLDRFAEAEVHLRRALAIFEAALGPDHLNCMGVHDNLGNALHALHRDSDAVEEHRRVFAIIDRAHLAVSPTDRAVFVLHLADALAGAGRIAEARPDLEQVLAHPEQIADPEVRAALARHLAHAKATKTIARAR
jgi:tetratricopeptide (TPR) repeat protein